jgi:hypothetical protein
MILLLPVVGQAEKAVITRHGKFARIQDPGRFILWPFEKVHTRIPANVQIFRAPQQKILLNDGMEVELAMILRYQLKDAKDDKTAPSKAAFVVENWKSAIEDKVAGPALYQAVAARNITELIVAQSTINEVIKDKIQGQIKDWGFRVIDVSLTDVHIPTQVREAIEKGYHLEWMAKKLSEIAVRRLKLIADSKDKDVKPEEIMGPNDLLILSYIEALQKMAEDKATKLLLPYDIVEAIGALGKQP